MAKQSLKDKTVKGVAWSGIDNVVQTGVTFVVSIVLSRLLSPDEDPLSLKTDVMPLEAAILAYS